MGRIIGVLFGIVLMFGSATTLIWNENRAVERAQALAEGKELAITIPAGSINPENDQKLVHLSAQAVTHEKLIDDVFGVNLNALKLKREVLVYQWQEEERKQENDAKKKNYTYHKVWKEGLIDSSLFQQAGHDNPKTVAYASDYWEASHVTTGAFTLSSELVAQIDNYKPFPVDQSTLDSAKPYQGGFYLGANPQNPQVGDIQVTYKAAHPSMVSVVAQQQATYLQTFLTNSGGKLTLLELGRVSKDLMFQHAVEANTVLTWLLRGGGFILMVVSLVLVLNPLTALFGVIPILGQFIQSGIGMLAFLLALSLSVIIIGFAWFAVRPVLTGILLIVAMVCWWLIYKRKPSVAA